MNRLFLFGWLALAASATSAAADSEPFIGEIVTFGTSFCPRGWMATDGRLIPISSNTALFSVLGTQYGGNGQTTFALPKIGAISAPNPSQFGPAAWMKSCIAAQGIFPSRS